MCVCVCSVAQLYPSLCDPMDGSLPGSSVHGIILARLLEWVAISSSIFFFFLAAPGLSCSMQDLFSCHIWDPELGPANS